MDTVGKGDLILKGVTGPDGEARLVTILQKVLPSAAPDRLLALLSKPKPFVLIRDIKETQARELMEMLQTQGAKVEFVPSAGEPVFSPGPPPGETSPVTREMPVQTPPADPYSTPPVVSSPDDRPETHIDTTAPTSPPDFTLHPQSPDQGITMGATQNREAQTAQPAVKPGPRCFALQFNGSAGEYFRIWIVNIALTILTLGIYGAWAKVRTRRYFYSNTLLDGQHFDYTARPGTILKGHLIIGGALILMNISGKFSPMTGYLISVVAWSLVPFLLYKAHRFKAKTAVYRNVHFRFLGTLVEAYKAYAFIPIAAALSLLVALPALGSAQDEAQSFTTLNMILAGVMILSGLIFAASFPYFVFLQKRYLHGNLAYGKTGSTFLGGARRIYGIYTRASLMILGVGIGVGTLGAILIPTMISMAGAEGQGVKAWVFGVGLIFYVAFGSVFLLVEQYIYASTFNYAWGNTRIGPITLKVSLEAKSLAWIRFTNVLVIIFSLGFLAPWAKIRRARYILPRTTVILPADMDAFEAAKGYEAGAAGDTAADFFDWDIGW
ncbi:MAG: DUF898 family protein [bacterium]|nr:DUF898 family protein [bacterium]MDT8366568.1 DUF898 family protein [bacterium]